MNTNNKYTLLILGIIFDTIGMLSFVIPGVGEFSDVNWAPLASFLIYKMYKGTEGKIGGLITFVDEILPGLDVIPTFTLMWVYRFMIKKQK
jgi:hypothetical protein